MVIEILVIMNYVKQYNVNTNNSLIRGGIYMEIVKNIEFKGIELYFGEKPEKKIIEILKNAKFRWHNIKKCWYAKENNNTLDLANKIFAYLNGETNLPEVKNINSVGENELGIKVGDIFYTSWGYEQTNIDFFQVVALKGKTQVVIREVALNKKEEVGVSGMSRDISFYTDKVRFLEKSCFIKDNEKGMIKKVQGTKENPYLSLDFSNAHLYKGQKLYESWYY